MDLVASNVVSFDPVGLGYVDKSGSVFVAGEDSLALGIGATESYPVKQFTKIDDSQFSNKAVRFIGGKHNSWILDAEGSLYATGYYSYGGDSCYPGWTELQNHNTYVKIFDNIIDFNANEKNRIAIGLDGIAYGWGDNYSGACGVLGNYTVTPIRYTLATNIRVNNTVMENSNLVMRLLG